MHLLIWLTTLAWSEETTEADGRIVVEESAPQTSGGSTIIVDESLPQTASIAEVLQRQSSVVVKDMGGLGTHATISIRGTSTRQNLVLLNGVPLNPDGNSTVNLQDIPLRMLGSMTLYRSHSPLKLMSSSIGGTLDLQTLDSPRTFHTGIDSWTNTWLRGTTPFQVGDSAGSIFVSSLFAENAYPYFDNRNTPFNSTDDRWKTRSNNDVMQGNFLGTWKLGALDLVHTGARKIQGVPGHIIIPTPDIRLHSNRHLTGLHRDWRRPSSDHDILLWHTQQREILDDSSGNLGQGDLVVDWSFHSVGLQGFHRHTSGDQWFPSVGWSSRLDLAWEQSETEPAPFQRISQQLQIGEEYIGNTWEWSARLNTHWLSTQSNKVVLAPKTSLLYHLSDQHHVWVSLLRGFRPPDLTEIYGNRGAIIGNPNLRPEIGTTIDLGWTRQTQLHWLSQLQFAAFARETQDEIVFVQNAQRQSLPMNFEQTRMMGIESEWTIDVHERLSWTGSLTLNHSENRSSDEALFGNAIPNVPRWMSGQQVWWRTNRIWLGTDVYWSDGNYWDAPNQRQAPTRLVQNATMRWTPTSWQVELTCRNLWNRIVVDTPIDPLNPQLGLHPEAVQDFLGYPLMGRSVAISVTWSPVD